MSVGMAAQQAGLRFLVQHSSSGLQENTLLGSSSPGSKGYDPLAIMLKNIYSPIAGSTGQSLPGQNSSVVLSSAE